MNTFRVKKLYKCKRIDQMQYQNSFILYNKCMNMTEQEIILTNSLGIHIFIEKKIHNKSVLIMSIKYKSKPTYSDNFLTYIYNRYVRNYTEFKKVYNDFINMISV